MTFVIGCLLILICIIIHALATRLAIYISNRPDRLKNKNFLSLFWIAFIVLLMFFASIIEAAAWAGAYLYLGAIESYADSLYFSIVTYTTLGYGDITLSESWRLLASFEAAIGIIIFGWSTALVMAVVQHFYFSKN